MSIFYVLEMEINRISKYLFSNSTYHSGYTYTITNGSLYDICTICGKHKRGQWPVAPERLIMTSIGVVGVAHTKKNI